MLSTLAEFELTRLKRQAEGIATTGHKYAEEKREQLRTPKNS
jgi:hypothetical protein